MSIFIYSVSTLYFIIIIIIYIYHSEFRHIGKGVSRAGELPPLVGEVSLDINCLYALKKTKKTSHLKIDPRSHE